MRNATEGVPYSAAGEASMRRAARSFALRARGLLRVSSSLAVTGFFVNGSHVVRSLNARFTRRSSSE